MRYVRLESAGNRDMLPVSTISDPWPGQSGRLQLRPTRPAVGFHRDLTPAGVRGETDYDDWQARV